MSREVGVMIVHRREPAHGRLPTTTQTRRTNTNTSNIAMKTITYTLALLLLACTAAGVRATDAGANPHVFVTGDGEHDCCSTCSESQRCIVFPDRCECHDVDVDHGPGPRIIRPGQPAESTTTTTGIKIKATAATKGSLSPSWLVNKGAEDDADDCCDKCAEDEACSTTPTGCECWKPGAEAKASAALRRSSAGSKGSLLGALSLKVPDEDALPLSNKGAEDDADDCCSKCAEDEACSTTPTGCECWKPSSVQALSMASLGGQEGDPAGIKIKASPTQALAERVHKELTRFVEEAGHHIGDADWDGVPETYLKALLDISERFADADVAGDYAASDGVEHEDLVAKIKALNELYASGRTTGLIPDDEGQTVPMHDTAESLHNNGAFLPFSASSLATGFTYPITLPSSAKVFGLPVDVQKNGDDDGADKDLEDAEKKADACCSKCADDEGCIWASSTDTCECFATDSAAVKALSARSGGSKGAAFRVGCAERTGCDYDYTLALAPRKFVEEAGHHLEHGPGLHDSVVAADYDGKVKNTLNFLKAGVIADDPDDQDFRPYEHSKSATKLFEPYHEVTDGKLNRGNAGAKIHPTVEEKHGVAVLGQANGVAVLGQANGFAHEAPEMSLTNGRPATHGGTGKDLQAAAGMTNTAEGGLNSFAVSNDAEGVVQPSAQPSSASGSSASKYAMAGGVGAFVLLAGGLAFAFRPAGQKKRAPEQAAAVPEAPVVHVV